MNSQANQASGCFTNPEREMLMSSFFEDLNNFMSARHGYKKHMCRPWVNKVDARCS